MILPSPLLASGDEAVALAALDGGAALGAGYPGTPSTEILECLSAHGGRAQWAPNEKVAYEVALGAAFGGARALVTMKHVGLNVAADPLFTSAYTGVPGALVVAVADDPGLASSQNEQDSRHYARAAGLPMLEPSDSQEAYAYTLGAFDLSARWGLPVILRLTTRVCHSKSALQRAALPVPPPVPGFTRDPRRLVMIPAYARPAHRRLAETLAAVAAWAETSDWHAVRPGDGSVGLVSSGAACLHAREAAPQVALMKLGLTWPLPVEAVRRFASGVRRCLVIEEGDAFLGDALRAAGVACESPPAPYRLGEWSVERVRRLLRGEPGPESPAPAGRPPQLCPGCPHRAAFDVLRRLACLVAGDIGCYTLGALPPYEAMDTCVCMGASIGVGLGLRHVLPVDQARRVVSVIGDSTFVHSGLTGLAEMVYNPPPTGHVILVLDNGTTAMTGLQEHPGTGLTLDRRPTGRVDPASVARAMGIEAVHVLDAAADPAGLERLLKAALESGRPAVIIARRPCLLAARRRRASAAPAPGPTQGEGKPACKP